jgi:DNA helicase-2/ATP-dependent DNA helicase PcrA
MLHGQTRYCAPSLFLEELPEELLRSVGSRPTYASMAPSGLEQTSGSGVQGSVGGFRIGQNVQHAKFGLGVIVAAEGYGNDARVQVNFGAHGMKWLALEFAKLTAA